MRTCSLPGCDVDITSTSSRQSTCSGEHGVALRSLNHQRKKDGLPPLGYRAGGLGARPHPLYAKNQPDAGCVKSDPVDLEPFPQAQASRWEITPATAESVAPGQYERIVCLGDAHLPFADPRAIGLALKIIKMYQPHRIVLLGDMLDMAGFARWPHDTTDRRMHFQTELDEWKSLATAIVEAAPNAVRHFLRGNHCGRLEKFLYGNPHLMSWQGLNLGQALGLRDLGFQPDVVDELSFCQGNLTMRHGTFLGGSFAGAAARQEMARAGTSGCSGHTHRAAQYIQRDKRGLRVWIECGHLALNPQHYSNGIQNWAQAVTVGEISVASNDFWLELVPFRLSYKARLNGVEVAG